VKGKAHRVGVRGLVQSYIEHFLGDDVEKHECPIENHAIAAELIVKYLQSKKISIGFIGHRFVHGGEYLKRTLLINDETLKLLEACLPLAPLHNPISLSVIHRCKKLLPDAIQYVTVDTVLSPTMPAYAYTYFLPNWVIRKYGFRKYGFHGLSYSYVMNVIASYLGKPIEELKMVLCHLGTGGSSIVAIRYGEMIDTSMGYSPLSGLMMSTRCGDIDPMLTLYLMAAFGYRQDEVINLLNKKSGILGVSGFSSDIRDVMEKYNETRQETCGLALKMYITRLKKYIGGYIVALGGTDVLAFTDDIGVNNPLIREKVCENMEWCGISIDTKLNSNVKNISPEIGIAHIHAPDSKAKIFVVPTDEELIIALEGEKLAKERIEG
jgi:acetate kinase